MHSGDVTGVELGVCVCVCVCVCRRQRIIPISISLYRYTYKYTSTHLLLLRQNDVIKHIVHGLRLAKRYWLYLLVAQRLC